MLTCHFLFILAHLLSFRMMAKIYSTILIVTTIVVSVVTLSTENETVNDIKNTTSSNLGNKIRKPKYCLSSNNVSAYLKEIMEKSDYNVHIVPTFENGNPLEIKLAMTVLIFRDMKEVDMTYTADFFLRTTWIDERLKNSLNCTFTLTLGKKHPGEVIWVPDTMIENSVTSYLHEVLTNNHKIDISPNGEVFWSTRVTAKAMCRMDLLKFPVDTQTCSLILLSYAYTKELVNYVWDETGVTVMDKTLSQFDVTSCSHTTYELQYIAGNYSILKATFVFERRLGYYFIQVYIPCIFLVVLAGLSFWVDTKATPARVALSLTTLLTITTIWSATNSNMPPVSYVKAVDIYFLTSFGFVLITLLEYILVLNYNIVKDVLKRKFSFRDKPKKSKANGTFCEKHGESLKLRAMATPKSNDEDIEMKYSNGMVENNNDMENNSKNKENEKKIVSNIDKITKFLYPGAYIIFNIVYWYELKK